MPNNLDQLAFQFFKTFARMEYALKATGYHCGDGQAKANWTEFSKSVVELFVKEKDVNFIEAIKCFNSHPPNKQMIVDGAIQWDDIKPNAKNEADKILLYIRRVRNNLFHGGKFNGHWFEPQRSEELLRYSLVILNRCKEANASVKTAYESEG